MKKITMMITALFVTFIGFAQWQNNNVVNRNYNNSSLIISTASYTPFTVVIDNYNTYQSNNNIATIGNLSNGSHNLVIYQMKRNVFGKQKREIVYSSNVFLKQGYETTISINSFGQANVYERLINNNYGNGNKYGNGKNNGKGNAYGRRKHKHCDNDDNQNRNGNRRNDDDN